MLTSVQIAECRGSRLPVDRFDPCVSAAQEIATSEPTELEITRSSDLLPVSTLRDDVEHWLQGVWGSGRFHSSEAKALWLWMLSMLRA